VLAAQDAGCRAGVVIASLGGGRDLLRPYSGNLGLGTGTTLVEFGQAALWVRVDDVVVRSRVLL
jgi:hypothetical protein